MTVLKEEVVDRHWCTSPETMPESFRGWWKCDTCGDFKYTFVNGNGGFTSSLGKGFVGRYRVWRGKQFKK